MRLDTYWIDGDIKIHLKDILNELKNKPILKIYPQLLKNIMVNIIIDENRLNSVDLYYPIIVLKKDNKLIKILDGNHRLMFAIKNKKPYILYKVLDVGKYKFFDY